MPPWKSLILRDDENFLEGSVCVCMQDGRCYMFVSIMRA